MQLVIRLAAIALGAIMLAAPAQAHGPPLGSAFCKELEEELDEWNKEDLAKGPTLKSITERTRLEMQKEYSDLDKSLLSLYAHLTDMHYDLIGLRQMIDLQMRMTLKVLCER